MQRGEGRVAAPPHRQARGRGLAAADGRVRQAREGAHLRGRHRLDHDDGDPLEGAAPEAAPPEPRAHHRRLPAADDLRHLRRTASRRSRRSRAAQGAGARPRGPDPRSQLSRAVEQRHDKRPILSDLRESGSLEQDSDIVIFIYRDEYYNDESDQQGLAEVHVAKHRNGPTDTIKLSFLRRYAKFSDLAAA